MPLLFVGALVALGYGALIVNDKVNSPPAGGISFTTVAVVAGGTITAIWLAKKAGALK